MKLEEGLTLNSKVPNFGLVPPSIGFRPTVQSPEASCDSPIHAILLQIGLNQAELANKKCQKISLRWNEPFRRYDPRSARGALRVK